MLGCVSGCGASVWFLVAHNEGIDGHFPRFFMGFQAEALDEQCLACDEIALRAAFVAPPPPHFYINRSEPIHPRAPETCNGSTPKASITSVSRVAVAWNLPPGRLRSRGPAGFGFGLIDAKLNLRSAGACGGAAESVTAMATTPAKREDTDPAHVMLVF